MSRASEYAINLFRQAKGPLRCLAASDPCGRRAPAPKAAAHATDADTAPRPSKPEKSAQ